MGQPLIGDILPRFYILLQRNFMMPVVETTGRFLVFHGKSISAGCPLQKYTKKMRDKTGTYQQAKTLHHGMELNQSLIVDVLPENVRIFRKHLSDITKRNQVNMGRKFVTRLINGKIFIQRIA